MAAECDAAEMEESMIDAADFAAGVKQIAARRPRYRTGGTGKDGTCDCIGLIMGAMYALGHARYALHSTNYFARYQMAGLGKARKKELYIGQLLFRARKSTEKLDERYRPGGRYYTGDMLDYYHVAVVTGTKPLRIIECTAYDGVNGIVESDEFSNWQYAGRLRGVEYGNEEEQGETDMAQEDKSLTVLYRARVATQEDPLMLRETPGGRKTAQLPRGAIVDVLSEGEWAHVRSGDLAGYASAKYLERIEEQEEQVSGGMNEAAVTIIDSAGNHFRPVGDWRVLFGSID